MELFQFVCAWLCWEGEEEGEEKGEGEACSTANLHAKDRGKKSLQSNTIS